MPYVIGPNGARAYVPDDVVAGIVGDGNRGYVVETEPVAPSPTAAPTRAPRKRARARKTTD